MMKKLGVKSLGLIPLYKFSYLTCKLFKNEKGISSYKIKIKLLEAKIQTKKSGVYEYGI